MSAAARRRLCAPATTAVLLRAWRASVPREEWRSSIEASLRAACAAQLEFGASGGATRPCLRVVGAPASAPSDASYSVIELIIEDMPFLVDTLSMTLAQLGLSAQHDHASDPARTARRRRAR